MSQVVLAIYGVVGFFLFLVVALRPRFFWPALIAAAVIGAGLKIGIYTFADEFLVGCVLIGGLLAISLGVVRFQKGEKDVWNHLHRWAFFIFIAYMIIQSVRGILLWGDDLEKIRWVVFYGMLGLIAFIAVHRGFSPLNWRKTALAVSLSALIYLILYLFHGFYTETVRGISRFAFEIQPTEWPTPAYALFLLVAAIPSAIFLIRDNNFKYQCLGWSVLFLAILAGFYYDARVALLAVSGFIFVSLFKLGIRKILFFSFCFILIFSLFFGTDNRTEKGSRTEGSYESLGVVYQVLSRTIKGVFLWGDSASDIDRKAHLEAGITSITGNWQSFLFGYGFRMHGLIIGPHIKKIYEDKGALHYAAGIRTGDDIGTEGLSVLLIDTGIIGVLLLGFNFFLTGARIIVQKTSRNRLMLLTALLFAFLWLLVINMIDIMLFYFLIMPQGLLIKLSEYNKEEA